MGWDTTLAIGRSAAPKADLNTAPRQVLDEEIAARARGQRSSAAKIAAATPLKVTSQLSRRQVPASRRPT